MFTTTAGNIRKHLSGALAYESFIPTPLQQVVLEPEDDFERLLSLAHERLKSLRNAPYADNISAEATASVRLAYYESTQPALFAIPPAYNPQKEADISSLLDATHWAVERLKDFPLSSRLWQDIHFIMMRGEHNEKKTPGWFRTSPIWLGDRTATLRTATFVPPVAEDMVEAITELEKYLHYEEQTDPLIMAALIHYQFVTIHPFLDGNGRIARLLTQLFLIDRGLLTAPVLPLSPYLLHFQFEYFSSLSSVQVAGNYDKWVRFFLKALANEHPRTQMPWQASAV